MKFQIMIPKHSHLCPGTKKINKNQEPHRKHIYPCYNNKCEMSHKRYCGLIVDAMLNNRHEKHMDKKFL